MAAKGPLREFGNDPVSERPVVAKDGKFGVYVTDGETNASIGKGDRLEDMLPERAFELLADPPRAGRRQGRPDRQAARRAPAQEGRGQEGTPPRSRRPQEASTPSECDGPTRASDGRIATVHRTAAAVHRPRGRRGLRQEHPGRAAGRRRSAPC